MNINVYLNLKKLSDDAKDAVNEYIKRISPFACLNVYTSKQVQPPLKASDTKSYIVIPAPASSCGCKTISSPDFAKKLNDMAVNGVSRINYYVGYSNEEIYKMIPDAGKNINPTEEFAVSSMYVNDELLAVVLSEQIYRAYTINNNITYHK